MVGERKEIYLNAAQARLSLYLVSADFVNQ
jgi:hypothetical protein